MCCKNDMSAMSKLEIIKAVKLEMLQILRDAEVKNVLMVHGSRCLRAVASHCGASSSVITMDHFYTITFDKFLPRHFLN